MNTHQVKAEAIDVVLVDPVFHALQHETAHHRTLRSCLVAAARAVGVGSVLGLTVIVVGESLLEIRMIDVVCVVVNHIEDDTDASFVQGLYHLFELADAADRVVRVRAVGSFGHVVVHRVIAPVVLVVLQACLIH